MGVTNVRQLDLESAALLIVDMQVSGCERHGPGVNPVIRNIQSLLGRFRREQGRVIHIQSVRSIDQPEFTVFGSKYSLLENTPDVEFIDELKPLVHEEVVLKTSHDCFYKTSLETVLERLDLRPCQDTIIITGIGANNCVYHAVLGFHVRNYFIVVPEDCIHASRPDGYTFAINQFRSSAYNFNVTVTQSGNIVLNSEKC